MCIHPGITKKTQVTRREARWYTQEHAKWLSTLGHANVFQIVILGMWEWAWRRHKKEGTYMEMGGGNAAKISHKWFLEGTHERKEEMKSDSIPTSQDSRTKLIWEASRELEHWHSLHTCYTGSAGIHTKKVAGEATRIVNAAMAEGWPNWWRPRQDMHQSTFMFMIWLKQTEDGYQDTRTK